MSFSADDLDLLRIAAIQYKRAHKINNSASLHKMADLKCDRNALPRFLSGDTNEFSEIGKLAEFLRKENYWPYYESSNVIYDMLAQFFQSERDDIVDNKLRSIIGSYEYYQWSSTRPGMVTVSEMDITYNTNLSRIRFCSVTERQLDLTVHKRESYEGCCFSSDKGIVFILRNKELKRPKFFVCNKQPSEDIRYGLLLKTSSKKSLHLSNIVIKRIGDGKLARPRIEYFSDIDDIVQERLRSPLTSLNLTESGKKYVDLRSNLENLLEKFILPKDE